MVIVWIFLDENFMDLINVLFCRMCHKLRFVDKSHKVLDANITDADRYEIFDPRNPMTKRRREASKQAMKDGKHEKESRR